MSFRPGIDIRGKSLRHFHSANGIAPRARTVLVERVDCRRIEAILLIVLGGGTGVDVAVTLMLLLA
jgi:hypothetical protein